MTESLVRSHLHELVNLLLPAISVKTLMSVSPNGVVIAAIVSVEFDGKARSSLRFLGVAAVVPKTP